MAATWLKVDLRRWFNNDGISWDRDRGNGDFDGRRRSYPAEELPPSNAEVEFAGAPFHFPDKADGVCNNIECAGQRIGVPRAPYASLHLLGASCKGRFREEFVLAGADGAEGRVVIGLSDWYSHYQSAAGEKAAIECSHAHAPLGDLRVQGSVNYPRIALQSVSLPAMTPLVAIELPYNPSMHIFALTLRQGQSGP